MHCKLCRILLSIIPGFSRWSLIKDYTRVFIFYASLITVIVFTTTLLCVDSEVWNVISVTNVCFFSFVIIGMLLEGLRLYIQDSKRKSKILELVNDNMKLKIRSSLESVIDYSNLGELGEPSRYNNSPVPNMDIDTVYENWPYYALAKKMVTKYGSIKGVWKDGKFKGKIKKKPKKRRVCFEHKIPDKRLRTKIDSTLPYKSTDVEDQAGDGAPKYKDERTESAVEIDHYSTDDISIELSSDSSSDVDSKELVQPEGDIHLEEFMEDDRYKGDKGKLPTSFGFSYRKRTCADTGASGRNLDTDASASGENHAETKSDADSGKESISGEDDSDSSSVKKQKSGNP